MPRIELKATELTNTDVDFVALVKRGANRIPFRITKGDDAVLDLYKLFKREKPSPAIVAIVTQKADLDGVSLRALAQAAGLGGKLTKSEDGGVVTFRPEDAKLEGAVLVKLDRDVAVAVAHTSLQKAFPEAEYVQGLNDASAGLHRSIVAAIAKADGVFDARDALIKATEDFRDYVTLLADHLPDAVFKVDQALAKAGTGNAMGGAATNQETGDGLGDQANGKAKKSLEAEGDPGAADPEMPKKNAKKADAGKNGTGEGFEAGGNTTNDRATADDQDEEIDAAPGGQVSGDSSGLPAKAKAPTQKAEAIAAAKAALAKAMAMEDDDSTNGAQGDLPPKAKAPTKKDGNIAEVRTVGESGEGARQAGDKGQTLDQRPEDSADADDANAGGKVAGKRKGKTLDMEGIPAGAKAPTAKNDGDADIGKKGKGRTAPDDMSEAGAQEKDVQTLKSDAVMQAIQALAKSVQESNAAVTKTVSALSERVEQVAVMAKKTDAALNGTVFNEDPEERQTWTRKSDNLPPLLDTGYSRRTA